MPELLSLGSVVKLRDYGHPVMVIGYGPINSMQEYFEYLGVNYPTGLSLGAKSIMFDSSVIEKILFNGYADEKTQSGYQALAKIVLK